MTRFRIVVGVLVLLVGVGVYVWASQLTRDIFKTQAAKDCEAVVRALPYASSSRYDDPARLRAAVAECLLRGGVRR